MIDSDQTIEWVDFDTRITYYDKPLKTYTKKLKDDLEAGYADDRTNFDQQFFQEWENFKEYLDKVIKKEKLMGEIDPELDPMPDWMKDLMVKVNQTYSVDNAAPIKFNDTFRAEVKSIYYQVFKTTGLGQFFDQISLSITDKKGISKYYGNDYMSTDCLYGAIT